MTYSRRSFHWGVRIALASIYGSLAAQEPAGTVDFDRDIRPIISEKCTVCHGPDDKKGGLQLSGIEFASQKLKSGNIAIVPGDPASSELVSRIQASDPDEVMPPPDKVEPLSDTEKDLLERWIVEGAAWPKHWAFTDLKRPPIPKVEHSPWVVSPIDAFVLEKLEKQAIAPSPKADRVTLIRRFFYDLVGLPPTADEVEFYDNAISHHEETGLGQLVDDLLASPHFGERWGRH